jgi:hypothetical protein
MSNTAHLAPEEKRERAFKLSIPAVVEGIDALQKEFKEKTRISRMSSQEAIFGLDSQVMIGSKLIVWLNIPRTLILEKPLTLSVSGIVNVIQTEKKNRKKQLVYLSLNKKYKIQKNFS